MKSIINVIAAATVMLTNSVAFAAQQPKANHPVNALLNVGEIHAALATELEINLASISTKKVSLDLTAIVAQAQLTNELDQYIADAKSELPKNRYRVVIAD